MGNRSRSINNKSATNSPHFLDLVVFPVSCFLNTTLESSLVSSRISAHFCSVENPYW